MPPHLLALILVALALPSNAFFPNLLDRVPPEPLQIAHNLSSGGVLELLFQPHLMSDLQESSQRSFRFLHRFKASPGEPKDVVLRFRSKDGLILRVVTPSNVTLAAKRSTDWGPINATHFPHANSALFNSSAATEVLLEAGYLGRTSIIFEIQNDTGWASMEDTYKVSVIRKRRWIDKSFSAAVVILVIIANLGMGTKLSLTVVKEVLKKPLAPLIGFCCQYTVMPLVAFGVGMLLDLPPNILLGYFAMGCAPGGGASNFFTYLLGGDVSLSITMTLLSTLAALGMVPLWLFTLGRYILQRQEHSVNIPFANIIISLVTMLVPIAIGYFIKRKLKKVAKVINLCIKPFLFLLFIFFFTGGLYANSYMFRLFSPTVLLAGCLLPYLGFILGGLIAFIIRLKKSFVKTVAIETGIQNTGVPIFLLKFSLPHPDSDVSIVGPIAASLFTPLPLFFVALVREIHRRCCKKEGMEDEEAVEEGEGSNGSNTEREKRKKRRQAKMEDKSESANGEVNGVELSPFLKI